MDRGPVKGSGAEPPGRDPRRAPRRRGLPSAGAPDAPDEPRRAPPRAGAAQRPADTEPRALRRPRATRPVPVAEESARRSAAEANADARRPRRMRPPQEGAAPPPQDAPVAPPETSAPPPAAEAPGEREAARRQPARRRSALPPAREDGAARAAGGDPAAPAAPIPPRRTAESATAEAAAPSPAKRRLQRGLVDAPDSDAIVENGPIVAPATVAGRSLTVIIAIMTFLCALLLGGAIVVDRAASAWSATVLDDISVSVLPLDGDPVGRRLQAAATLMREAPGLSEVTIVPSVESEALLRPWLGTGTDLSLLPVPRLVTARRDRAFDADALADALAAVPGASLDDHSAWSERLERMAGGATLGALLALGLILGATAIAIVFATRAAIAGNAATVEVLSVLGAEDGFVVRAFRSRFLRIGLRGALLGLLAALLLFGVLEVWSHLSAGAASRQAEALLGAPRIGAVGFAAIVLLALAIAGLVTLTTSLAVRHHLKTLSR